MDFRAPGPAAFSSAEIRETLILKVAAMLHHLAEPLAFPLLPCSQSSDIPRALGALAAPPDWAPPPCGRAAVMGS